MKPLRALGVFALMVAALLALIGAGSASATVLCTNSSCTTTYASGTTIDYTLKSGTTSILKSTSGELAATCAGSTIKGNTSSESGASISSSIESLTWSSCSQTTDTIKKGSLSITWTSGTNNGSVSSSGSEVTATVFGISCTYGTGEGTTLGTLTGGETPVLAISAVVKKTAGSFLCPGNTTWTAEYVITEPHALFVGNTGGGGGGATSTTLTTSLSGEGKSGEEITVNEGSKVKDTATLSGTNASKATGTVKYKVYADKECKELVTSAGEVTVTSGSVPASEEKELEAGRVYYWQAEYSGDTNNLSSKSTCGKEVLTIKAKTSIATSLSGASKSGEEITVNEGSKVKDTATLSGTKSSTATGKVKFKAYKDKECKELASEAGEGSLSEGKASSEEKTLGAAAVYYWQAEYPGDSLHQPSTSTCGKEVLTVKAKISIATALQGEGKGGEEVSVALGSPVGDTATLGGTDAANATGTVEYFVYSDSKCKELVAEAGEVSVAGGSAPLSEEEKLEEGIYYWQAVYSGDSLHEAATSSCGSEVARVIAATAVTTSLSGEGHEEAEIGVVEGSPVTDTATLSGKHAAEAEGTVAYAVYGDSGCEELVAKAGEVTVSGGIVPASSEETLEPGVYYWQAEYSGDSVNHTAKSSCGSEVEIVGPPVTTMLSAGEVSEEDIEVLEGTAVTDQATLYGAHASEATGTVEYFVYSDSECKELVAEAGEVSVEGEEAPPSSEETLKAGTYYWQAVYSGGGEMPPATSPCGSEIEVVTTSVSVSTSLSGGGKEGEVIEVEAGSAVSDQATLSGPNVSTAEGSVEYSVYANSECTELVAMGGIETLNEGSVPSSEAQTLPVGTYYWQAEYSGDGLNHAATSSCGSEIEVVTAPITTTLSGGELAGDEIEVPEATAVTDRATLHGPHASEATGTIEYFVYSDNKCEKLVTKAGTVTVKGAEAPSSSEETLEPGTYFWQAHYSGDAKNPAATSSCGSETETVEAPAVKKYAALGDSFSSGEGIGAYYARTNQGIPFLHLNLCHRSEEAWPARVATALFGGAGPIAEKEVFQQNPASFIFRACNGAVMSNVWAEGGAPASGQEDEAIIGPPEKWLKTPAQHRWLMVPGGVATPAKPDAGIKLVTLTIGGNDAGFAKIGRACVTQAFDYTLANCRTTIANFEASGLTAIETRLPGILEHIQEMAPKAKIRVPLYPRLLNLRANQNIELGVVKVKGFKVRLRIDNVEVKDPPPPAPQSPANMKHLTAARAMERFLGRLNLAVTESVREAASAGVQVKAFTETVDAFDGHRLGNKVPWVNGAVEAYPMESFHPNRCGHIALARGFLKGTKVPMGKWPASC
jgi:putative sterol carrier protein